MKTTRRKFLGGMAVATALSGAAAAKAVTPSTTESEQLIALGEKFDAILSEFTECEAALPAFQESYRLLAPCMPADLLHHNGWRLGYTDFMNDPAEPNYEPMRDVHRKKLEVVQSHRIEARYGATFGKDAKMADFTDADEEDMRLYGVARAYEQGVEHAQEKLRASMILSQAIWSDLGEDA